MSTIDHVRPEGPSSKPRSSLPGWLILLVGLVAGVAVGVLLSQSSSSSSASAPTLVDETVTSSQPVNTTASTAPATGAESLREDILALEAELAATEERALELMLEFDPAGTAAAVGCDDGFSIQFGADWQLNSLFVGPMWFFPADSLTFGGGRSPDVLFVGVERGESVTLVVPATERDRLALGWNPAIPGDGTIQSGGRAVTLQACPHFPTVFSGTFLSTQAYCAPVDVYFGDELEPNRILVPIGVSDCPAGPVPLVRPEISPLPDVTGLTLREARLAIRAVAAVPTVNDGEAFGPDSMVWAQEPNDGSTYEVGTAVGLRTCESGSDVVATYQERLDGTGIAVSDAWMVPSHDSQLESWWFISGRISGGTEDGQIATWGMPGFGLGTGVDPVNTPDWSIPANGASESFEFGDRRFTPEDFGVDDWLDLDGAVISQRCVEASVG